jgi:predicted DNA-binding protein (MmcQ/YjbR family)
VGRRRVEPEERVLAKLRELCLALPSSCETRTWGHPNFRAGTKIFAAFHEDRRGSPCIWLRVEPQTRDLLGEDPRFTRSAHGGASWLGLRADLPVDWSLVRALALEGYRIVARKSMLAELDGGPAPALSRRRSRGGSAPRSRARAARGAARR